MRFDVISILPEIIHEPLKWGVIGQAIKKGLLDVNFINPRKFTSNIHQTVDDRPYGGGDGMVMMVEPLRRALEEAGEFKAARPLRVYLSPHGKKFDQKVGRELMVHDQIILVCGRYGGIDQRFIHRYVDMELSVGDFVLSGGELAAALIIDVMGRLVPGVLGNERSSIDESFTDSLLECPQFTRPESYEGSAVPAVLLSGNHAEISKWRRLVSLLKTRALRPDLLKLADISEKEWRQADALFQSMTEDERRLCGLSDKGTYCGPQT